MQAIMNFNGLQRQGSQEGHILDNTQKKKNSLWYRRSLRGNTDRHRQISGSQPRVCKYKQTTPLVDYMDPQRTAVNLEKQDNESFGFEIQTYGLHAKNSSAVEMFTFVCKVKEDSVAENAGLTTGDIIVTINGVCIEGLSHQQILELVRESANKLQVETVCGSIMKHMELEKKLAQLKQTLREKCKELQALSLQEKRLIRGTSQENSTLLTEDCPTALSPLSGRFGRRFSSDSSFRSVATDDSDQTSVFGDLISPDPCSSASTSDEAHFFTTEFSSHSSLRRASASSDPHHQLLSRSSSSSLAGSTCSLSPSWEDSKISSLFGTLPRKGRSRRSVRKNIFKLIPGLQRSVEEEELGTSVS